MSPPPSPARASILIENLASITSRLTSVQTTYKQPVRLVLVSKLKPASDILALHTSSATINGEQASHFGENYVQELVDKAKQLPKSIKWHFIGGLQSNKCKQVSSIPNLWCVSSVDSAKKADLLEKGRAALMSAKATDSTSEVASEEVQVLRVKVQVNTSSEESKSGVEPSEAPALCEHILKECPHLKLAGLMTIGAIARSQSAASTEDENEDFTKLSETRDAVAKALGIPNGELELSMGMSADWEAAVAHGSNEVRIGSTIFGERPPKQT
jgi:PLP dependent protein